MGVFIANVDGRFQDKKYDSNEKDSSGGFADIINCVYFAIVTLGTLDLET